MQTLDRSMTVAQIVATHPTCARVFQNHRIDFCCRGGVSVEEACRSQGVDAQAVYAELERVIDEGRGGEDRDFAAMTSSALIAYIVERHHAYLRRAIPWIAQMASKVARVHGAHNPKLPDLHATYGDLVNLLLDHLDHEEQVLFPALLSNAGAREVVARELHEMHRDHLVVGEMLQRIRALSDDFTVPEWGCGSYRALLGELEKMEEDILRHVHLENHVLMPRHQPPEGADAGHHH
ncbi:MAG: iron-sulfur cluster repair di-iron protein [Myxococcota bacterium]